MASGPFYVLFDADRTPILDTRPEGVSLGAPKSLLPVVITCATREDAQVALRLKYSVFRHNPDTDAHTIAYLVENAPYDLVEQKIYCIRCGGDAKSKTGVWLGYSWGDIESNIDANRQKAKWIRRDSLKEAIIWMLRKSGHNIPLLPAGAAIPPPQTRPPANAPPASPAPASSRRAERSQTANSVGPSGGTQPGTPSRFSRSAAPATAQQDSGVERTPACPGDAEDDVFHDALAMLSVQDQAVDTVDQSAVIRLLAAFVSPLPSIRSSGLEPYRLPITFGPLADEILAMKAVSAADLLTILSMRVHSAREEVFSHYMGLALDWKPLEAVALWRAMEFPRI